MGLRIQNNVEAFNAHRQLTGTAGKAAKAMEKLSSGYRINRAADDAAGLAISEKMRGQISGLAQAQRNAQDGVSLVQTAEGALNEVHSMLQRVRDLKVQHDNATLSDSDKSAIVAEVKQLAGEIYEIADKTEFNGNKLFGGTEGFDFQVGANDGEVISTTAVALVGAAGASVAGSSGATSASGDDVASAAGGKGTGVYDVLNVAFDLTTASGVTTKTDDASATSNFADLTLESIDNAIGNVSTARGELGAVQNRMEHRLANLATYQENLVASESRIRDVDMAAEMVNFTKLQILQQAGTSMLAQANQSPQSVLSLLQ